MARLMSVTLTEQAVIARQKTVTRRLGWQMLKPGDQLSLCRKVMGRKRADGTVEPLVRLAHVEVVTTRRERLNQITDMDVVREGFPVWTRTQFIDFFCREMKTHPQVPLTRIEWRYVDPAATRPEAAP